MHPGKSLTRQEEENKFETSNIQSGFVAAQAVWLLIQEKK